MFNYKWYFEFFIFLRALYCQEVHLHINHYCAIQIQTYIKL